MPSITKESQKEGQWFSILISKHSVYGRVLAERERQEAKWKGQKNADSYWLAILVEEVGEVAEAFLKGKQEQMFEEVIHVIATAVAWLEQRGISLF